MDTTKTIESLIIAEQVDDARLLLERRGDPDKQLPARSQARQARFEIRTKRVQPRAGQESLLERRVGEAAQQRTPVVIRAEGMMGKQIFAVLPPVRQLLCEPCHRLVGPCPVAKQAGQAIEMASFNDPSAGALA